MGGMHCLSNANLPIQYWRFGLVNQQVVRPGTETPFVDDLAHRITIRFVVNQSHFLVELNELAPQMSDRQLLSRLQKNNSKRD